MVNDHLGTPQMVLSSSGQTVWQAAYFLYGQADVQVATIEFNLRFPGQYYDAETGLHYNWHRYYDPQTGRYLTPDPIGLDGGINPYEYVGGNPVNFTDPSGLSKTDPWYGYNNRDFQRWFHRCWKEKGGPRVTPKEEIKEAYEEWIRRGAPKNGKCWGGNLKNRRSAPMTEVFLTK